MPFGMGMNDNPNLMNMQQNKIGNPMMMNNPYPIGVMNPFSKI